MRNLSNRIVRLEKIVQLRPPAPCPDCGTPRGWVAGLEVRNADGVSLDEHCPACGIAVHLGIPVCPVAPGGYRDVLVLPAGSAPLPV